jgi:hypothetical protein
MNALCGFTQGEGQASLETVISWSRCRGLSLPAPDTRGLLGDVLVNRDRLLAQPHL